MRIHAVIVVVALFSQALAQSPQVRSTPKHEPVTEDLSKGATFTFTIAPRLPEFAFEVVPQVEKPDAEGNPQSIVKDVRVFRGTSKKPLQSLEGCKWVGEFAMQPPYRDADWFRVEDINFDGYADIFVLTTWGATGNEAGCVWLFNPKTGHFEFSKDFSELGGFEVDADSKTITVRGRGGLGTFQAAKYIVEHNRPVPIISVAQDFDPKTREYHCVVSRRRGRRGTLVMVRDVTVISKTDFDWPCDSGDPFQGIGDR